METSMSNAAKQGHDSVETARDYVGGQAKRGMDALDDMRSQAKDAMSGASDSIIAYTKENPVKALGIAAAAGMVVYALIKALIPSRD